MALFAILAARREHAATFRVTRVPGKDLGVVASRDIEEGERVIVEAPLLRLTPDGDGRYDGRYEGDDRSRARALLATLSIAADHLASSAGDTLNRVIETNAIRIMPNSEPGRATVFSVVFLTISRFNHSCAANAEFRWNSALGKGCIHVERHVAAGEEICFNYGVCGTRAERQRHLRERFRFECDCDLCVTEGQGANRGHGQGGGVGESGGSRAADAADANTSAARAVIEELLDVLELCGADWSETLAVLVDEDVNLQRCSTRAVSEQTRSCAAHT